jgi:hypothetical protein
MFHTNPNWDARMCLLRLLLGRHAVRTLNNPTQHLCKICVLS